MRKAVDGRRSVGGRGLLFIWHSYTTLQVQGVTDTDHVRKDYLG